MNGFLFCFIVYSKNLSTSTHTRRINDLDTYTKYIHIYTYIYIYIEINVLLNTYKETYTS